MKWNTKNKLNNTKAQIAISLGGGDGRGGGRQSKRIATASKQGSNKRKKVDIQLPLINSEYGQHVERRYLCRAHGSLIPA